MRVMKEHIFLTDMYQMNYDTCYNTRTAILLNQFSLSCYLKTRDYQEPELLNLLLFPTHSCNICAGLNGSIMCQV
jgi:hypothetical protein